MILAGGPIEPHHRAALHARWIDDELIERSFVRSVSSAAGAEITGSRGSGDYTGIAIPYIDPGADHVRDYRVRRDHPEIENGKPKGKYLAPPGRGNMLYFPPGTNPTWLTDASLPLLITEGEFKALALFRLANYALSDAAERPRFLVCALSGVWNFRGTIGKLTDSGGVRVDEKGPIPDLAKINWAGRTVTIVFDANVTENDSVRAARKELTRELQGRQAVVRWFEW